VILDTNPSRISLWNCGVPWGIFQIPFNIFVGRPVANPYPIDSYGTSCRSFVVRK
jgi:hypothetical protein